MTLDIGCIVCWKKGISCLNVTELITNNNLSDRKEKMLELVDAFIALPGGIGTLDEISEAIINKNWRD